MLNPGFHSLGQFTITTAGTQVSDAVELDGILALTIKARFAWGSGGTSCRLYIQSSSDDEATWDDVACILFASAPESPLLNLSKLTPKTTQLVPTDGAMADDTAVDGIITARMRCKIVTTGTYGGSTILSVSGDAS